MSAAIDSSSIPKEFHPFVHPHIKWTPYEYVKTILVLIFLVPIRLIWTTTLLTIGVIVMSLTHADDEVINQDGWVRSSSQAKTQKKYCSFSFFFLFFLSKTFFTRFSIATTHPSDWLSAHWHSDALAAVWLSVLLHDAWRA
jgi:hypothetical protein